MFWMSREWSKYTTAAYIMRVTIYVIQLSTGAMKRFVNLKSQNPGLKALVAIGGMRYMYILNAVQRWEQASYTGHCTYECSNYWISSIEQDGTKDQKNTPR